MSPVEAFGGQNRLQSLQSPRCLRLQRSLPAPWLEAGTKWPHPWKHVKGAVLPLVRLLGWER